MAKLQVTKKFVEKSLEMAEDLYGIADCNGCSDIKKILRPHIKQCKKLLEIQ